MISLVLTALLTVQVAPEVAVRAPSGGLAPVNVLVTLTEEPAARVFDRVKAGSGLPPEESIAAAKAAAAAQARKVRQQQDRLVDALKQAPYRATLIYRLERGTNAIAIRVSRALLSQLLTLPSVKTAQIIDTDKQTGQTRSAAGGALSTASTRN